MRLSELTIVTTMSITPGAPSYLVVLEVISGRPAPASVL